MIKKSEVTKFPTFLSLIAIRNTILDNFVAKYNYMATNFFNPFENLYFDEDTCFLTGEDLVDKENDFIYLFPEWVMDQFDCWDRKITMMDPKNSYLFRDLKLPCSQRAKAAFDQLDNEVKEAFAKGYEAVKNLDSQRLFLWMGKNVYGMLYHELMIEKQTAFEKDEEFKMHQHLKERFGFFHLMLQSILTPIEFEERKPWSVTVVKVKYSQNFFNYRDDTVNLLFSLGVKGFGIIGLMQDNGAIPEANKEMLDKIGDRELHAIQFEELCARFQYFNYLLQYKPKYVLSKNNDNLHVKALQIVADEERSLFGQWEDSMFAKVLAGYWKPWGLEEKDIMKAEQPVTFLEDVYTYQLIDADSIDFPY